MALDNLLADSKPNPCARVLVARVKSAEGNEQLSEVFRINPNPLIADCNLPFIALPLSRDMDKRWVALAGEPDSIGQQVLE
jgi:hypothetical protein